VKEYSVTPKETEDETIVTNKEEADPDDACAGVTETDADGANTSQKPSIQELSDGYQNDDGEEEMGEDPPELQDI
jgi:hypothetical protein